MAARFWLVAVAALVACARPAPGGLDVERGMSPRELGSTVNVRVDGDSVRFELHVTNVTREAVTLEFGSAQRYDFVVSDAEGRVLWQWSAERSFAQVVGREVLQPDESRRFEAAWSPGALRGEYVATGRLTSLNYPVELRTVVRLPGE
jgi:hypothetical protein